MNSVFVTGTDTGAGKTWTSLALMQYFKHQGKSVIGMKPVAAGCEWIDGELKNEDALLLQQYSSVKLKYQAINPYAYEAAVSPHLAGVKNPVQIEVLKKAFQDLSEKADVIVVEGAGGWMVPINEKQDIADLAIELNIPVVMVVAIRLGCINHARLTFQAIEASKVNCIGWLAICIEPAMERLGENIQTLEAKITAPLLGIIPFLEEINVEQLAENIIEKKII